jgi:regulator of protease activity HflC (stomatin/prohibitin superfamily)
MNYEEEPWYKKKAWIALILIVIVFVAGLGILFTCTYSVPMSYAGLLVDPWGRTVSEPMIGPITFGLKTPWQYLVTFYLGTQIIDMWTDIEDPKKIGDYPTVHCNSKDGLWIDVDVTIRFHLIPSRVRELYLNYTALDWKEKTVAPIMRRAIRDIVSEYTAIQVIEKRAEIAGRLTDVLQTTLNEQPSLNQAIHIEGVDLRDIWLAEEFQAAVNAKLAAEQMMIAAQFNATQVIIMANATAEAMIRQAWGISESNLMIANATAKAIQEIAEQTGMNSTEVGRIYLQMILLKEIAERNPNIRFVVLIGVPEKLFYMIPIENP